MGAEITHFIVLETGLGFLFWAFQQGLDFLFSVKENKQYPGFGSMFIVSVPTGSRSISGGNISWLRATQKVPLARG
jgi:hypothetical protein